MTAQEQTNNRNIDIALLLLRVTFGGLMLYSHGWGKLMTLLGDAPINFADPIGIGMTATLCLAIFAEVICAFLIVIGCLTRAATIPLIVTMLIAIFIVHINDPFSRIEFALLYLAPFIALLLTGAGSYSIDAMRNKP